MNTTPIKFKVENTFKKAFDVYPGSITSLADLSVSRRVLRLVKEGYVSAKLVATDEEGNLLGESFHDGVSEYIELHIAGGDLPQRIVRIELMFYYTDLNAEFGSIITVKEGEDEFHIELTEEAYNFSPSDDEEE